jgi:polar amino acid transport system permease protein
VTFDVAYAIEILPALLRGAAVTVLAALLSFLIAAGIGPIFAVARSSHRRSIRSITGAGVDFIRGTPLLIQLFVAFYILPLYGLTFEPLVVGVAVLGLHYSSYTSEVYRAGIQGVPGGQWEAAKALNMSGRQTWRRIILPQAIPRVIPPLGNYLVAIFKETPILATITVGELLRAALTEASLSFRFLEPFVLVGAFFLAMSYPSTVFIRRLERRFVVR